LICLKPTPHFAQVGVTLRVIRDEVFADASEAQEVPEALPPN
jgi:hypothetical protein